MDPETVSFGSSEEEAKHWKQVATEFKRKYQESKDELDEFQVNSRELEAELEAQLEQIEQRNRDFTSFNGRLQMENSILKEKLEKIQNDSYRQISDLQEKLGRTEGKRDELHKYIRELEQSNDDLERTKRAAVVSLEDFESRLNHAIERNAFLESELDDKDTLVVAVQRLKDEARDLRNELQIRNRHPSLPNTPEPDNDRCREKIVIPIDSNKLSTSESETQTIPGSPIKANIQLVPAGTPLTPSARISALNIVGDLLRKVGALESKLASCRNFVRETPARSYQSKPSPHNSPRSRRVNRGIAAGSIVKINA